MKRIVECVPNFSEGRDQTVIDGIVEAIRMAGPDDDGVKVLHVDVGAGANRTVVTFTGSPEAVCEAAFQGARAAARLIDMRCHHGEHPRIGATDVLPIVPVSGVTLEECAAMARALARRMSDELGIPCYCYEAAAYRETFRNLAVCRAGEYESLPAKIADPGLRPDFGPDCFNDVVARTGASVVGARDFLIAVNFNLASTSVPLAQAIACDVRQRGWSSNVSRWPSGFEPTAKPFTLKGCKAIGWYIEEYGIAQVSMNITDMASTPLHVAYEAVCSAARARGAEVTGTEIIGLVPLRVLTSAGRYFGADGCDEALVQTAIRAMHLDDLCPFDARRKVIEYRMEEA